MTAPVDGPHVGSESGATPSPSAPLNPEDSSRIELARLREDHQQGEAAAAAAALLRADALAAVEAYLERLGPLEAQDLYLSVDALPVARVADKLLPLGEHPLTSADLKRLASPFLTRRRLDAFRERPELDLAHEVPGVGRFRLNLFLQRGQLALVARRVRPDVPTIDGLGLPPVLARLATLRQGLVCVTGATGSGKSTTLAAMIDHRNESTPGHILTIEDPIEYLHPHKSAIVSQREIGRDTARFEDALRSALRQAPDVLLIGEIRDAETAEAALHFAETGHLVLATLHSTTAAQALERLVHLFPAEQARHIYLLLSLNLAGIVCQRLVPALAGEGRVAALELLVPTGRIRDLIRAGDIDGAQEALREAGVEDDGLRTFDESLYRLVRERRISQEKALCYADQPNDLKMRFLGDRGPPEEELQRIRLSRD